MSQVHSRNTTPEKIVRAELWRRGYRYRLNDKRLPGKPDLVLPKYRAVIFINGCFWHGHKGCSSSRIPQSNADYWRSKVLRNQRRDQEVWRQLEANGWGVIIVWECQLKKSILVETISRIEAEIIQNRAALLQAQKDRRKANEEYRQEMRARKDRKAAVNADLLKKKHTGPFPKKTTAGNFPTTRTPLAKAIIDDF